MSTKAPSSLDEGVESSGAKTEEFWPYLGGAAPQNHPFGQEPKKHKEGE